MIQLRSLLKDTKLQRNINKCKDFRLVSTCVVSSTRGCNITTSHDNKTLSKLDNQLTTNTRPLSRSWSCVTHRKSHTGLCRATLTNVRSPTSIVTPPYMKARTLTHSLLTPLQDKTYHKNVSFKCANFIPTSNFHTGAALFSVVDDPSVSDKSEILTKEINGGSENESVFTSPFDSDIASDANLDINLQPLVEPRFEELGLGGGWPSGWAQTFMEFLHIDIGYPWWQVIAMTTLTLRTIVFPVVILSQRNAVRMNNHLPTIQKLQIQQQLASARGELDNARFAMKALNRYYMENNCHPIKSMMPMIVQGCFFASMFFALRGMTNVPVESLKSGGLHWFTDLTICDPFYLLPIITSTTIFVQLYLGADGMNTATLPPIMKKVIYLMPLISLPFMIQFPAALNLYWLSNNCISIIQASLLRNTTIRSKLGVEEMIKWEQKDLPLNSFNNELMQEYKKREIEIEKIKLQKSKDLLERKRAEMERRQQLLKSLEDEDKKIKNRELTEDQYVKSKEEKDAKKDS